MQVPSASEICTKYMCVGITFNTSAKAISSLVIHQKNKDSKKKINYLPSSAECPIKLTIGNN